VSTLPNKDRADRPDVARDRQTPAWVKVLGVIALVLLVAFVVSRLLGIQHGPDLHSWSPANLAVAEGFSAAA
jgi:hypothetical protein